MADTVKEIHARFANEAANYRNVAHIVNFEFNDFSKMMIDYIGSIFTYRSARLKVLDIGAGTGMLSEVLLQNYPNAQVTLLDNSPEMLAQAESYFETIGGGYKNNITTCLTDFISGSFPNEEYDLVISSFALHHIRNSEDLVKVYKKIWTSLKPEIGTFFCIDYYIEPDKKQRRKQIADAIRSWIELGFTQEEAHKWAKIIENEDTPASISELFFDIKEATNCLPLIHPQNGIMTCLYGFTSLSQETILNSKLKPLLMSWHNPERTNVNWYLNLAEQYIDKFPASDVIQESNPKL